ncbi:M23 family peptidase, partial [Streptomyces cyaneofuscatus]
GNSTGPHLHFEARSGADYGTDMDPVAYLRGHGVDV